MSNELSLSSVGSLISSISGFLLVSLAGGWVLGTGKPTTVAVFGVCLVKAWDKRLGISGNVSFGKSKRKPLACSPWSSS